MRRFLPRIVALGDIDEDELAFAEEAEYGGAAPLDIPAKTGELERPAGGGKTRSARLGPSARVLSPLVVGGLPRRLGAAG